MILEFDNFTFDEKDHCWLEHTKAKDYFEDHKCNGCGTEMEDFVFIKNSKGEQGLTTGICKKCGYIKRTRNLRSEVIDEHFSNRWLNLRAKDDFQEKNAIFTLLKPYISNENLSVLDVGCGNGDQLIAFEKNGFRTFGVEPSKSRSDTAKKHLVSSHITNGFSEQYLSESKNLFDIICIENVLQFVEDPFALIDLALNRLEDEGLLYIKAQRFEWSGFAFFSVISIIRSYLDLHSLRSVIEKNRLNILHHHDFPFILILKKSEELDENTKRMLHKAEMINNDLISKVAAKEFLGIKSLITGTSHIKNRTMKRSLKFKVIDRNPSLPIEIRTEDDLPVVLK